MRIGIDATSWFNGRGYGRYTRELLRALFERGAEHEFVLLVEQRNAPGLTDLPANVTVRGIVCDASQTESASAEGNRSPRDLLRFTGAVREESLDVLYFPTVYTYFPVPKSCVSVVTIHDTIAERFPELTLPTWRDRLFWRLKVWLALRQSDAVLTVSDYSARDIKARFGVPDAQLRVTSEAPSPVYRPGFTDAERTAVLARHDLPQGARWFTYVGGFNPHKRVDRLIEAHARLADACENPPYLLLVGSIDSDVFHGCRDALVQRIARLGTHSLVRWAGFVADDDLRALHAGALACVLPSECEGFGLPAVEAAACGTPAIATTESPLPEVLEGGGFFVAPSDDEGLFEAMRTLTFDPHERAERGLRALERAQALSWPRAADIVLDTLLAAAHGALEGAVA